MDGGIHETVLIGLLDEICLNKKVRFMSRNKTNKEKRTCL